MEVSLKREPRIPCCDRLTGQARKSRYCGPESGPFATYLGGRSMPFFSMTGRTPDEVRNSSKAFAAAE